jgi:CubicO group peptidase (beta-lactamase class C family)
MSAREGGLHDAEQLVRTAVETGDLPGAVLHVRAQGRIVLERAFGRRRIDEDVPLRADDIFPVASLTKPLVAVGILRLCEQGALHLDDPIVRYLPEFAGPTVLVDYNLETRAMVTRPASGVITVRHLLTHTAGIHHGFPSVDEVMGTLYERAGVVHGDLMPMEEKVRRLGPLPLAHDPGHAWTYGLSSDVAGRLIEVVAGQPLDRYLERWIFEPLQMSSTYFFVPGQERSRLVSPHVRRDDRLVLPSWSRDAGQRYLSGGGGLHTTAADYGLFVQMLLDGGAPVVSRESVELMTRNQIGSLTAFGFKYGLSIGIATNEARGENLFPVGGFGWYGIYSTWFWTLLRQRTAVLFFSNVLAPGTNLSLFARVMIEVEAALDRSLAAEPRQ